jgi:hypothetical protein
MSKGFVRLTVVGAWNKECLKEPEFVGCIAYKEQWAGALMDVENKVIAVSVVLNITFIALMGMMYFKDKESGHPLVLWNCSMVLEKALFSTADPKQGELALLCLFLEEVVRFLYHLDTGMLREIYGVNGQGRSRRLYSGVMKIKGTLLERIVTYPLETIQYSLLENPAGSMKKLSRKDNLDLRLFSLILSKDLIYGSIASLVLQGRMKKIVDRLAKLDGRLKEIGEAVTVLYTFGARDERYGLLTYLVAWMRSFMKMYEEAVVV